MAHAVLAFSPELAREDQSRNKKSPTITGGTPKSARIAWGAEQTSTKVTASRGDHGRITVEIERPLLLTHVGASSDDQAPRPRRKKALADKSIVLP
jgi:hypothetical protein